LVDEMVLVFYVSDLSNRVVYGKIRKHLSALGFAYRAAGRIQEFNSFSYLRLVLKGCKRLLGNSQRPKLAILPWMLQRFQGSLQFRAMSSLAFFALLRTSELLFSQTWRPSI
jgi:hypothetical protein